mmetsp:Transcript_10169/g.17917  ORF Transcript_10169/g.17917 Transcript_10169/m.17917 type:complete len:201 (-) Transcript_10169:1354-1956(-)
MSLNSSSAGFSSTVLLLSSALSPSSPLELLSRLVRRVRFNIGAMVAAAASSFDTDASSVECLRFALFSFSRILDAADLFASASGAGAALMGPWPSRPRPKANTSVGGGGAWSWRWFRRGTRWRLSACCNCVCARARWCPPRRLVLACCAFLRLSFSSRRLRRAKISSSTIPSMPINTSTRSKFTLPSVVRYPRMVGKTRR